MCRYFLSDATHEGSGTVENMRGSHRSMNNAYAQTDILFKPITANPPIQTREVLTPEDEGTDPSLYSAVHDVLHGPAGTIFAFREHHHLLVRGASRGLTELFAQRTGSGCPCVSGGMRVRGSLAICTRFGDADPQ